MVILQILVLSIFAGTVIKCVQSVGHMDKAHEREQHHNGVPDQFGAIFMLVTGYWKESQGGNCHFNVSMDSLSLKWRPHNPYPIVLLDTKIWSRADMVGIRRTWPTLDFKFLNIGKIFNSVPENLTPDQFEDAKEPIASLLFKKMCHFFFKGFTEVQLLMDYKYLLRIDDINCILDNINYDIFELMERRKAVYAYNAVWNDGAKYTRGIYSFTDKYVSEHKLNWKNPTLHNATISSPNFPDSVPNFNSNFEVINTVQYRSPAVMQYVNAVVDSNMIFHRRWGDAALRFIQAQLFWPENKLLKLVEFEVLHHSSFNTHPMMEHSDSANPELYR